jgi:DNA topoisomerase-1
MKIQVSERELLDPGYRRAYTPTKEVEHVASGQSCLADLKRGQRVKPKKFRVHQHGMTEADLIAVLQKNGIGRPATYALIMETLIQRRYVEFGSGRSLIVTPRGKAVLEFLVSKYPGLFSVEFTAKMEAELNGIAKKRRSYRMVVGQLWNEVTMK